MGCDSIGNAFGGFSYSGLHIDRFSGARFEDWHSKDIGGSNILPDFGSFYRGRSPDKAGLGINMGGLDNGGAMDLAPS